LVNLLFSDDFFRTKNATDRHDADVVAFNNQCGVSLIFSPPENAILS